MVILTSDLRINKPFKNILESNWDKVILVAEPNRSGSLHNRTHLYYTTFFRLISSNKLFIGRDTSWTITSTEAFNDIIRIFPRGREYLLSLNTMRVYATDGSSAPRPLVPNMLFSRLLANTEDGGRGNALFRHFLYNGFDCCRIRSLEAFRFLQKYANDTEIDIIYLAGAEIDITSALRDIANKFSQARLGSKTIELRPGRKGLGEFARYENHESFGSTSWKKKTVNGQEVEDKSGFIINIRLDADQSQIFHTLAHELAHNVIMLREERQVGVADKLNPYQHHSETFWKILLEGNNSTLAFVKSKLSSADQVRLDNFIKIEPNPDVENNLTRDIRFPSQGKLLNHRILRRKYLNTNETSAKSQWETISYDLLKKTNELMDAIAPLPGAPANTRWGWENAAERDKRWIKIEVKRRSEENKKSGEESQYKIFIYHNNDEAIDPDLKSYIDSNYSASGWEISTVAEYKLIYQPPNGNSALWTSHQIEYNYSRRALESLAALGIEKNDLDNLWNKLVSWKNSDFASALIADAADTNILEKIDKVIVPEDLEIAFNNWPPKPREVPTVVPSKFQNFLNYWNQFYTKIETNWRVWERELEVREEVFLNLPDDQLNAIRYEEIASDGTIMKRALKLAEKIKYWKDKITENTTNNTTSSYAEVSIYQGGNWVNVDTINQPLNLSINLLTGSNQSKLPLKLYDITRGAGHLTADDMTTLNGDVIVGNGVTKYATLSYVWGEEGPRNQMYPNARKSLTKAIRALEHINNGKNDVDKVNHLWIDQLCIDQTSNTEKDTEVPKMRQYYSNATITLIAINTDFPNDHFRSPNNTDLDILGIIYNSNWVKRRWTSQEGILSQQTIFMFDDKLIDGRNLATVWTEERGKSDIKQPVNRRAFESSFLENVGSAFSQAVLVPWHTFEGMLSYLWNGVKAAAAWINGWTNPAEIRADRGKIQVSLDNGTTWSGNIDPTIVPRNEANNFATKITDKKVATPVGWMTHKSSDKQGLVNQVDLNISQALRITQNRASGVPIDGIYALLGLLPYGEKIANLHYKSNSPDGTWPSYSKKDLEDALKEVMITGIRHGYGAPLTWVGQKTTNDSPCWVPEAKDLTKGIFRVEWGIKIKHSENLQNAANSIINSDDSITVKGRKHNFKITGEKIEYKNKFDLGERGSVSDSTEEIDEKLWSKDTDLTKKDNGGISIIGTEETIDSLKEGNTYTLLVPDRELWGIANTKIIAILLKENKKNNEVHHREDIVKLNCDWNELTSATEHDIKIGGLIQEVNEQYQAQIQVPPK